MKHDKQSLLGEHYFQLKQQLLADIAPIYKLEHGYLIGMIDPKANSMEDLTVMGLALLYNFIKNNADVQTMARVLNSKLVFKHEKATQAQA